MKIFGAADISDLPIIFFNIVMVWAGGGRHPCFSPWQPLGEMRNIHIGPLTLLLLSGGVLKVNSLARTSGLELWPQQRKTSRTILLLLGPGLSEIQVRQSFPNLYKNRIRFRGAPSCWHFCTYRRGAGVRCFRHRACITHRKEIASQEKFASFGAFAEKK